MIITKTSIEGLYIFEPKVFEDDRGYFFEVWNRKNLGLNNIDFVPVQQNESVSKYGVIRGLHYQLAPCSQAKLVRVISGEILDVTVDLRHNSPTFGKHFSILLTDKNKKQFFIPKGFAHGFSVLSECAILSYLCDEYYSPEHERTIRYNNSHLNIDWRIPKGNEIVSEKDLKGLDFFVAEKNF
jgi:dTDP-4-dehydrorhamnose 3,5-epimerase